MDNWLEKYEQKKEEQIEKRMNEELRELLNSLENTYTDKKRAKIIERIIQIYEELKINASEYDEKDYAKKKKESIQIKYRLMEQEHQDEKETQSWKEYKEEETKRENEELIDERLYNNNRWWISRM